LCEACCGLEVGLSEAGDVVRIRGDRRDVWSAGYLCPKGPALKQLHEDPDRLRAPVVRRGGRLVEVGWDEAFAEAGRRLGAVVAGHGRQALAIYVGNPNAHNLGGQLYLKGLIKALGTANIFTASTVDQRPKEISSALLFGTPMSVAVPDIDRTDLLVVLGANPVDSNGSLATSPDWPGRLAALRARGGRLIVVDPRRTATAAQADEHIAVRPGGDAFLLFAVLRVLALRARRGARAGGAVLARGGRGRHRRPPRHGAAAGPVAGGGAGGLRLRPHRHHRRRVRHAGLVAGRRRQRRHRQPRPAGRGHVRHGGDRVGQHAGAGPGGPAVPSRPPPQPG